jgi:hypothetical protein
MASRGFAEAARSTMDQLADWSASADTILVF